MVHAAAALASTRRTSDTCGHTPPDGRPGSDVSNDQWPKARGVEAALPPHGIGGIPGLDAAAFYQSAMEVGGDYCDMWTMVDGRLAFAVGDVCGKGLLAAMVKAYLQGLVRSAVSLWTGPAEALAHVNDLLCDSLSEGLFATLFLGVLDPITGQLEYVNAGHLPPVMVSPQGEMHPLGRPRHLPLGIAREELFETCSCSLHPDWALVLVTDGVTETFSTDGRMFGLDGLRRILETSRACASGSIVRALARAVAEFRHPLPQQDDEAMLVLIHHRSWSPAITNEANQRNARPTADGDSWSAWC